MKVVRSVLQMQDICVKLLGKGKSIGFVPTMGALHEGHLSLMRRAGRENEILVASIFVNPTQFGPKEDYRKYPRPFSRDRQLAKKSGVDYLFVPSVSGMYPEGLSCSVRVQGLTHLLCGASRPGHFDGVTTVVTKLFNIVCPSRAYFGQKDYQQASVIKKLVKDLNFSVKIVVMPIVREKDGLAISSRNKYLSPKERKAALVLYRVLSMAKDIFASGKSPKAKDVIKKLKSFIANEPLTKIDYVKIVNGKNLKDVKTVRTGDVFALALYIGSTRLIDNTIIRR
ncbi:MAG: pantoate--beta-alanine ligase [bacterium]